MSELKQQYTIQITRGLEASSESVEVNHLVDIFFLLLAHIQRTLPEHTVEEQLSLEQELLATITLTGNQLSPGQLQELITALHSAAWHANTFDGVNVEIDLVRQLLQ